MCTVHDITIRYNTISHVGNGFQIGNGKTDQGAISAGAWNESIHDIVMDDVDAVTYNGGGYLLQEGNSNPQSALHDVVVNHVTAVGPSVSGMLVVGNDLTNPTMNNFTWTNNILLSGNSGVISTGGGSVNCAFHPGGALAILTAYLLQPLRFQQQCGGGRSRNMASRNLYSSDGECRFLRQLQQR